VQRHDASKQQLDEYLWRMKYFLVMGFYLLMALSGRAQAYADDIQTHRQNYKDDFLKDEHSPLSKEDTAFLRFFEADSSYRVSAVFYSVKDTLGFDMLTHSGVKKKYFVYGYLLFHLKDHYCKLFVYQSEKLRTQKGLEDYLFVPFQDETNYETSFGGGRYLDFKISDIREGILILDFNKAYNPYCAYKGGYHCPIPPRENHLYFKIPAGEQLYGKAPEEDAH
jgi:uncharacterized protein (DUF1684 family)